jgi:hypothetical protein
MVSSPRAVGDAGTKKYPRFKSMDESPRMQFTRILRECLELVPEMEALKQRFEVPRHKYKQRSPWIFCILALLGITLTVIAIIEYGGSVSAVKISLIGFPASVIVPFIVLRLMPSYRKSARIRIEFDVKYHQNWLPLKEMADNLIAHLCFKAEEQMPQYRQVLAHNMNYTHYIIDNKDKRKW